MNETKKFYDTTKNRESYEMSGADSWAGSEQCVYDVTATGSDES